MLAIVTKFKGATDHKGSRVMARAGKNSVTLSWDHALGSVENHKTAALALCKRFGWVGTLAMGGYDNGYVFVFVDGYAEVVS